jgi:hypothetical protein
LPSILVQATFSQNLSAGHSANITYNRLTTAGAWTNSQVATGTFDINAPATAGVYLAAQVDFVGGGSDGRRGVDRVFGGWVQQESAAEDIVGTYQNSHRIASVFATNAGAATGTYAGRLFLPVDPAPTLAPPPLLDTGRGSPGNGGDSSTLTRSRMGTSSNLTQGRRTLVEVVDSAGQPLPALHPGFAASALTNFRFNLTWQAYLVVWSNVTGVIGGTGNVADRTYAVVLEQPWNIRATYSIDAAGNGTAVGSPSVNLGTPVTHNPVVPRPSTGSIMVPPTSLSMLALDGRR